MLGGSHRQLIDPSAKISTKAKLADDVEIGAYSIIGDDVEIGPRTKIGPHVVIKGPTVIGADNRIFQFSSIGDDPQDKKFAGEETRLEIGVRNTIREFCTINRGTVQDSGLTRVNDDNWIMAYVHIAHDCMVGSNTILANNATLGGHVRIGDFAILGGFAGVHQFCRVGAHCFIGMYSRLSQDVPPYITVSGQPPAPKGINSEGLKRREYSRAQISNIRNAYRVLYRSGLKLVEAVAELERVAESQEEIRIMVEFLKQSERSVLR